METGNEDIEMLKALIQESFSEQRELINPAGNGTGCHDQHQWQADAGQPRHAPAAESLRPDPYPLA